MKRLLPLLLFIACQAEKNTLSQFKLISTDTFHFNNFVDCNMAEVWVGDTLRIFPGKYGEDPVWGAAYD